MSKPFLILIFTFVSLFLYAQDKINFNIQPKNATIRIDGQLIQKANKETFTLELKSGTHTIEIWAPEFELFIDEFTVNPDKENTYSKGLLTQSEGFKAYKSKLKKYNSAKFSNILSTIGAVAGNAAMYYVIWDGGKVKDLNEMEARLEIAQNSFTEAVHPDDIQMIRANFDQTKASYNEQVKSLNTRRAIGIPIGMGVSALSYMLLKKKKKPEKPTYNPENPLVLNNINLNMNQGLALQLNFNF
jgi:hypothetical protein